MRVAIFADLHGKILLPFRLADLYQRQTGKKIDYILQCGDIGVFPNLKNLDKATIRHASYDRDELGFYDNFTKSDPAIEKYLHTLGLQMICVRGNHEDHAYLDALEDKADMQSMFPVDVYGRVFVCKTGVGQVIEAGDEQMRFVGIGRIGDRKGRTDSMFIQPYEQVVLKKLAQSNESFDLLITHDKDDQSQRGYGMAEIRKLLDNLIFQYHFYGHTGEPFYEQPDENGVTKSVKIKELEFGPSGILDYGTMVVVTKEKGLLTMEVVPQQFTNQVTRYNWKVSF